MLEGLDRGRASIALQFATVAQKWTCGCGLALLLVSADPTSAQLRRLRIDDQPVCATCRLDLFHVVTLGASSDSTSPWDLIGVAVDSQDRFFVAPMSDRVTIGHYDRAGVLRGTLGRAGKGPGEFAWAQEVHAISGDTLVVVDPIAHRYTVYSPDLELVRVVPTDFALSGVLPVDSERLVAHARVATPQLVGMPLHVLANGKRLRSFGEERSAVTIAGVSEVRAIGGLRGGRFWAGRVNQYVVEQFDTLGNRHAILTGEREWFELWTRHPGSPELVRPPTQLVSVRQDTAGLLWLMFHVAKSDWRPLRGPRDPEPRGSAVARLSLVYEALIEVVDPRTGDLLVSQRVPRLLRADLMGDTDIYETRTETESGWIAVDLWRVRLNRDSGATESKENHR